MKKGPQGIQSFEVEATNHLKLETKLKKEKVRHQLLFEAHLANIHNG